MADPEAPVFDEEESSLPFPSELPGTGFNVFSQKVELDIDFARCSVKGKTELTIQPSRKDLRIIRLNCRQCYPTRVTVEGRTSRQWYTEDPYARLKLHERVGIRQFHFLKNRTNKIEDGTSGTEELIIHIPPSVKVEEVDGQSTFAQNMLLGRSGGADGDAPAIKREESQGAVYRHIRVSIDFIVEDIRDGLQFVGSNESDLKYPHVYTKNSRFPGMASCLFPCVDNATSRCSWELSIRCPRTLGDAFKARFRKRQNGIRHDGSAGDVDMTDFSDEDKNLELSVIASGDMTDEVICPRDSSRKIVSFNLLTPVAAQHLGFVIGPFEHIDLSEFRDSDQDEMLGQSAIRVHGFCLPGRAEEVRNTCMMLPAATDFFATKFGSYPFTSYKICFVEDLAAEVGDAASLSICSTRSLYPETVLDQIDTVTRTLVHALAGQWIGVHVIPAEPEDWWLVIGGSLYMSDMFLMTLFGKNDYRFRQRMIADEVFRLDVKRPSVVDIGKVLSIHPGEYHFLKLKAPSVLFILNSRLIKANGRNGITRCLEKMLLNAKTGQLQNAAISTADFQHTCEKIGHMKLETFFNQWVRGAGCPHFDVTQRFNKKKLQVEIMITQTQAAPIDDTHEAYLNSNNFMREVKEDNHGVYAGLVQPVFTGPMTIRIHEADGTPYEHIIEVRERHFRVDIPYFTKYKRLKRNRRQKERAALAAGVDITGDTQDDVLIYCLGDKLQSEEEIKEWRLEDWSKEVEEQMGQESYEWIRMDADFEWLGQIEMHMPNYMFVSQLQQDKDVAAQVESIRFLMRERPSALISSIMTRTLMDSRYFHGIRVMASDALAVMAHADADWIGLFHLEKAFQDMFCLANSPLPKSNDFTDRNRYIMQLSIPKAISKIKNHQGRTPLSVKRFLFDKLRLNDNSANDYSDSFYLGALMECLAKSLSKGNMISGFEEDEDIEEMEFDKKAIEEIKRHQRIDEWIPSFRNILTTTALSCTLHLIKEGVLPKLLTEFIQYARPGNADNVRIRAFRCLVELGMLKNEAFADFFLWNIEADPSPYFREKLHEVLAFGLGQIATGELQTAEEEAAAVANGDGLVVEQEDLTAKRQAAFKRRSSVSAAKEALKQDLGEVKAIQRGLERALRSDITGVSEISDLLDVCGLLYKPVDHFPVTLKYPRYWKVQNKGRGRLVFKQTNKLRMQPRVKPKTKEEPPPVPPAPVAAQKLTIPALPPSSAVHTVPPTVVPPPAKPVPSPATAPVVSPVVVPTATPKPPPPSPGSAPAVQPVSKPVSTPVPPRPAPPARSGSILKLKLGSRAPSLMNLSSSPTPNASHAMSPPASGPLVSSTPQPSTTAANTPTNSLKRSATAAALSTPDTGHPSKRRIVRLKVSTSKLKQLQSGTKIATYPPNIYSSTSKAGANPASSRSSSTSAVANPNASTSLRKEKSASAHAHGHSSANPATNSSTPLTPSSASSVRHSSISAASSTPFGKPKAAAAAAAAFGWGGAPGSGGGKPAGASKSNPAAMAAAAVLGGTNGAVNGSSGGASVGSGAVPSAAVSTTEKKEPSEPPVVKKTGGFPKLKLKFGSSSGGGGAGKSSSPP